MYLVVLILNNTIMIFVPNNSMQSKQKKSNQYHDALLEALNANKLERLSAINNLTNSDLF